MLVCVMVVFEPNLLSLQASLAAIVEQVDLLYVVDNASSNMCASDWMKIEACTKIKLVLLKNNMGIAAAQNIGIRLARECKSKYILLMDQDSIPASDMVKQLQIALKNLPDAAAVGPVYLSEHQNETPSFTRVQGLRRVQKFCNKANPIVETDALIASGCLIPMRVIDKVGNMREDLFVDYVDTEWGLRAKNFGYSSYAVWSAKMSHQLGSRAIAFMGRQMITHSPLRRYYQYRNAVLLYKMKHIPINWKIVDALRLFLRACFYVSTNHPRIQNLKMICLGLWHGILGRTGDLRKHGVSPTSNKFN